MAWWVIIGSNFLISEAKLKVAGLKIPSWELRYTSLFVSFKEIKSPWLSQIYKKKEKEYYKKEELENN